jgi:hypothetical protein
MYSAEVRAMRHTAAVCGMACGVGMIAVANAAKAELATAGEQGKSTKSRAVKATLAPTMTAATQVCGCIACLPCEFACLLMRAWWGGCAQLIETLDQVLDVLFNGLVVHRFRDFAAVVRVDVVLLLGEWAQGNSTFRQSKSVESCLIHDSASPHCCMRHAALSVSCRLSGFSSTLFGC